MILVGRNISSGDDVVISICKLLLATEGRFTSVASVISKMLGNYYWDYAVSKSVYVYFHSREEVRLELDSSWTLVGLPFYNENRRI